MTSTSRTAHLLAQPASPNVPGVSTTLTPLVWPAKAPGDTLDYTLDCTQFLADEGGDTITTSSVTITVSPSDVTYASPALTTTTLTWDFSGGTAGLNYTVTIGFSTAGGLQVRREIMMPVAIL